MFEIVLLFGSNLGDRRKHLLDAINEINNRVGEPKALSSIYKTSPWGFSAESDFLNAVLVAETKLHPNELIHQILSIEKKLGRERKNQNVYESRPIDIDILFYGDRVINEPGLVIPHPRLHERRFTLVPLNEVRPGLVHPVLGKPVSQLLEECEDMLDVQVFEKIHLEKILKYK